LQKIGKGHADHEEGEEGLVRHLTKTGTMDMEQGYASALRGEQSNGIGTGKRDKM